MSETAPAPSASGRANELLDPKFMRRLDQLAVLSRKVFRGQMKGERRSRKKGVSVEFADYRDYVPGDDLRFIDWNIYGRLDRLFRKGQLLGETAGENLVHGRQTAPGARSRQSGDVHYPISPATIRGNAEYPGRRASGSSDDTVSPSGPKATRTEGTPAARAVA